MYLPKHSVEDWVAPLQEPLVTTVAARVSLDDGATWIDAERPDENHVTLLIAHPAAETPGLAHVITEDCELVLVEFVDGPRRVVREAGNIILG